MVVSIDNISPIVLCGGSGTRLWPLSRRDYPKQFVPLINGKSLLQLTFDRLRSFSDIIAIGSEAQRFLVEEAALSASFDILQILEPEGRDTAPAMALGALAGGEDSDLLLFCPADHYIPDTNAFVGMVEQAVPAAMDGKIVTFGVMPHSPSTAYGYIEMGEKLDNGCYQSHGFLEKPVFERATAFLASGRHVWNAGIFLVRRDVLIKELATFEPEMLEACRRAMSKSVPDGLFRRPDAAEFASATAKSIDYAVMEKADNVVIFPFAGSWSDVGSWNALSDMSLSDSSGNSLGGATENIKTIETENTFVHADPNRLIVTMGVRDLIVVDTPDALLISSRDKVEDVKKVVAELVAEDRSQAVAHRKVARPWGAYDSIEIGERHQVKRITVKPGAKLSLQHHHHRAEHWIVVKGTALVTCDERKFLLRENESTYIPLGAVHRMENPGKIPLEMIEVQSGTYLGEDDIVRLDDDYGRNFSETEGRTE
ncbi:mannose-1-phosphate guanylyltransferase/mannose-6-phosphate isomerase [Thalassospira sp. MCCC 1A01428]|uniref:mannose-1-phosphate guanylyltransferase/mannose-6-phosphate isomerase n=1 Tax=Thalassospira sp. MCCC 1A01428 TaxID=1470575 RepID=UPI000A1FB6D3|nr:mannose-1-phosphate guanylyltransferase/mannose-6-phosphate isomerase [Thalassospira sp. MCCC 1A01428]OSQ41789.1 mannose-1-phosphate guanyltransferase [Thalassospira sp. MCCC 1A01428]